MAISSLPCLAFHVKRCKPELVVPSKPTPHEVKYLSDIDDQEGLRFQVPFIWFYKNKKNHNNNTTPSMELGKDPVKVIREGLGKALVYYYPFAGRLMEGYNRKLIVECNGKGVLFIEADADISLGQLGDRIQPPYSFLDEFLHNVKGSDGILGCPLLLIQVTRLACGGFVLALRFNHTMCDSFGVFLFLKTMAEMADGTEQPSIPPVWRREVLTARNPPRVSCIHHEYHQQAISMTGQMDLLDQTSNLVQRSFFFGANQIKAIQNHLPQNLMSRFSRYELLTACLWRCRTLALKLNDEDIVRVSCMLTARGKDQGSSLPLGYYGNAFAFPAAVSTAGDLCKNSLGYAAVLVKKAKAEMNEEYIKSVADLMVMNGRPTYTATGNFLVSDVRNARLGDVDFGWGLPEYAGPAMAFPRISFYVKHRNKGEDGILVPICLPSLAMERFQKELMAMTQEEAKATEIISKL